MNSTDDLTSVAGSPSSTQIESGIRDTRQRMDSTLDELGQRLSPRSLLNSAMDWWEDNKRIAAGRPVVKQAYHTFTRQVKSHPVPALLIGAGVTWLLLNPEDEELDGPVPRRGYTTDGDEHTPPWFADRRAPETEATQDDEGPGLVNRIKDKASEAKEAVSGMLDSAKSSLHGVEDAAHTARQKAQHLYASSKRASHELVDKGSDLASQAREKLHRGYDTSVQQVRDAVDDYPLAVGAACLALGALVGVMLPRTRREDTMLGRKSDELIKTAREKGEEWLDQGKAVAAEVGHKVLDEARDKGLAPEKAGEALTGLASKAGEVIRHAVGEAGAAVSSAVGEDKGDEPAGQKA